VNLINLLQRVNPPLPWQEGDNIPWNEPGFSKRMLVEHLTQTHDLASRRTYLIDQHVAWIHEALLRSHPARILDLGCGPGLYCSRLAAHGHQCVGIDYSPASIAHARQEAECDHLEIEYIEEDIRSASFGAAFDLVMLLFGEFNVFSRQDAAYLLSKAFDALLPGGQILLEAHTHASLLPDPQARNTWFTSSGGLFSPSPHLVLIEQHWQPEHSILTRRYYIVDAVTAAITRYAQSMQAYTSAAYRQMLEEAGFVQVASLPGLAHDRLAAAPEFHAIIAHKPN
jgi:SAM-dependent methyltransferase